jgi:single-stranded-DNA-specific exonuclease
MGEKEITSSFFGFSLAPHVNAAGRMGHAEDALKLLLCDKTTEAGAIASLLCEYNRLRKREEELIFKEAQEQILQEGYENDALLVLAKEGWHHGVLGIVAAKITEKYGRPSFLLSFEGEEGRGSCRSVQGVDLVALLTAVKEHTVKFGGHEMAAGLTVTREELPRLRKALLSVFEENFKIESADEKQEQADAVLSAYDLTLPFAESLSLLEPFGEGNPTPRFLLENVQIEGVTPLSMGKHTKLLLEKDGLLFTALLFSKKTALFPYIEGDTASVVFELSVNEYMKKKSVQLLVRQIFPMGAAADAFLEGKEAYLRLTERKPCAVTFPERTDFARVYTLLRAMKQSGEESFSLRILSLKAGCASLAQCMLILLVFKENSALSLY